MLEIVFSDSARGSLKAAQHYGGGRYPGGAVGVIISHPDGSKPSRSEIRAAQRKAEQQFRSEWENAVPMGGNPGDVYSFPLVLSVGSIASGCTGAARLDLLSRLYSCYPGDTGLTAAKELILRVQQDLASFQNRAAAGEAVRIWYSNQPDDACGLYWLMHQLQQREAGGQVLLVKLPDWELQGQVIVQHNGWGEVSPGEWHRYPALQKEAPPVLIQSYAHRWAELQQEDTPLRAVVNGVLQSVPEDFYDSFILREIAAEQEEFLEAHVIGRVLGKYQLGIGDGWISLRIEELIRSGRLEVLSEAPEDHPTYHRQLRKTARFPKP